MSENRVIDEAKEKTMIMILLQAVTDESVDWVFRQQENIGQVLCECYLPNIANSDRVAISSLQTIETIAASQTAMGKLVTSRGAMDMIATSSKAMTAVVASSTAMAAVAASSTAMAAVAASSTAMTAVAASSTAMTAIENSVTACNALASSPLIVTKTGLSFTKVVQTAYSGKCFVVSAMQTAVMNSSYYLYVGNRVIGGGEINVGALTVTYENYKSVGKFVNPLVYRNDYSSLGNYFCVKYIPC